MFFTVVQNWLQAPAGTRNAAFLVVDNWDDWFSYQTQFSLFYYDDAGERIRLGSVKIGQQGLRPARGVDAAPGLRSPEIPATFDALDARFFSLGQDENYYETLNGLAEEPRARILNGLRDCAHELAIFDLYRFEDVMGRSLLRSVPEVNVRGRLNRLAHGDATLTEYQFAYKMPIPDGEADSALLAFEVAPNSEPPTNVHVLIGRNGVGKTRCMRGIAQALLGRDGENTGQIWLLPGADWTFSGLAMISFSAFDDFDLRPLPHDKIPSKQVGLLQWDYVEEDRTEYVRMKTPADLAEDFADSFSLCRTGLRAERWRAAVETLEGDDLFAEAGATLLLGQPDETWREQAIYLYKKLSSGHAIVLLTMTRLVEVVDERTLVLLDEPEGHLHPPLLSAFIRALSDLLVKRNGVAIIATHSPVVLQEVPRSCAWKLRRSRLVAVAERPAVESFGENVSLLTREVFGFEVTKSGFHRLLDDAVNRQRLSYDEVIERFGNQLGAEARAIVRALVAERDALKDLL